MTQWISWLWQAMCNGICCGGLGNVLKRAIDFNAEGQRKNGISERTWKKLIEEEIIKDGVTMEDVLCQSSFIVFY